MCVKTIIILMTKKNSLLVKIQSISGSGHYYLKKKKNINIKKKIILKKYDPIFRKHFNYIEKDF